MDYVFVLKQYIFPIITSILSYLVKRINDKKREDGRSIRPAMF